MELLLITEISETITFFVKIGVADYNLYTLIALTILTATLGLRKAHFG